MYLACNEFPWVAKSPVPSAHRFPLHHPLITLPLSYDFHPRYAISAIAHWKMLGQVSAGTSRGASIDLDRTTVAVVGTTHGGASSGLAAATAAAAAAVAEPPPVASASSSGQAAAAAAAMVAAAVTASGGGGGPKAIAPRGGGGGGTPLLDPHALRIALQKAAAAATASAKRQMASLSESLPPMAGFGAGFGGFFGRVSGTGNAPHVTGHAQEETASTAGITPPIEATVPADTMGVTEESLMTAPPIISAELQRLSLSSPTAGGAAAIGRAGDILIGGPGSPSSPSRLQQQQPGGHALSSINCMTQLQIKAAAAAAPMADGRPSRAEEEAATALLTTPVLEEETSAQTAECEGLRGDCLTEGGSESEGMGMADGSSHIYSTGLLGEDGGSKSGGEEEAGKPMTRKMLRSTTKAALKVLHDGEDGDDENLPSLGI